LTDEECKQLHDIDNALVHHEFEDLHYQGIYEYSPRLYMNHNFAEGRMADVEKEFIEMTQKIMSSIGKTEQCIRE